MQYEPLAVVDVETTGLRPDRDRVLQVAVVLRSAAGVTERQWVSLVRPRWGRLARLGPTGIHGITHPSLRHAPRRPQVRQELGGLLAGRIVVAHNLPFDWSFVRRLLGPGTEVPLRGLCTLELARTVEPDHPEGHSLGALCRRYGIGQGRPHDALDDARATSELLDRLLEQLPDPPLVPLVQR
ncbi:MAG: exonuclease domain-containing protein [Acidimicrobiales bacterium]